MSRVNAKGRELMNSNLPPGVSENMIPGNRPEDEAHEKFWDQLCTALMEKSGWSQEQVDELADDDNEMIRDLVDHVLDLAYTLGMQDGRAEEQMAQASMGPYSIRREADLWTVYRSNTEKIGQGTTEAAAWQLIDHLQSQEQEG
jgi:hypothetical protein